MTFFLDGGEEDGFIEIERDLSVELADIIATLSSRVIYSRKTREVLHA